MLEIKRLAGHSVIYGIGQALSQSASLLALPFTTRYLTPEDYAIISLATIVCILLRIVLGLGASTAVGIEYFKSEDADSRRAVVVSQMMIAFVSAGLLLLLNVLFAPTISRLVLGSETPNGVLATRLSLLILVFQILYEPLMLKLNFDQMAKKFVVFVVLGNIGGISLSLLLVIVAGMGVQGWLIGQLAAAALLCAAAFLFEAPRSFLVAGSGKIIASMLALSAPMIPGAVAIFLLQRSGLYFINREFGLGESGVFTAGYQLGMGMALATTAFSVAWMPFFQGFVSRQDEGFVAFEKVTKIYICVFGTLTLFFFGFSKLVVSVVVGAKFQDAWHVVGPIALGQFFLGFWGLLLPKVYFDRRTGYVSIAQVIAAVIVVTAGPIVVEKTGVTGAAILQAVGFFLILALQSVLNWHFEMSTRYVTASSIVSLIAVPVLCGLIYDLVASRDLFGGLAWSCAVIAIFALATGAIFLASWRHTRGVQDA